MTTYQWLCLVGMPTIILSFFTWISLTVRKTIKETKAIKKGMQAELRYRMISDYNKYSEKGYAPLYVKENFENCYVSYHELGANGVMDDLHKKFMALPLEEKQNKKRSKK